VKWIVVFGSGIFGIRFFFEKMRNIKKELPKLLFSGILQLILFMFFISSNSVWK